MIPLRSVDSPNLVSFSSKPAYWWMRPSTPNETFGAEPKWREACGSSDFCGYPLRSNRMALNVVEYVATRESNLA